MVAAYQGNGGANARLMRERLSLYPLQCGRPNRKRRFSPGVCWIIGWQGSEVRGQKSEVSSLLVADQARREFAECLAFDLAHSLAGQAERQTDFLECLGILIVEAETHAQHRRLA